MATIKSFEDIEAWQKAIRLSKEIFELTTVEHFLEILVFGIKLTGHQVL